MFGFGYHLYFPAQPVGRFGALVRLDKPYSHRFLLHPLGTCHRFYSRISSGSAFPVLVDYHRRYPSFALFFCIDMLAMSSEQSRSQT